VLRLGKGIAVGDIKLLIVDIVQKHVDAAEVVGAQVDFLPKEAHADLFLAQDLGELQKQRSRAATGVIDLVYLLFIHHGDFRQKFRDFLRREKLSSGLPGAACVHGHQKLIGIAEGINGVILEMSQL